MLSDTVPIIYHPLAIHFLGQIDKQLSNDDLTDKGFVGHLSNIITSKSIDCEVKSTPIDLITPRITKETLEPGNLYNINCKLIASNTICNDQLHFIDGSKVKIDNPENNLTESDAILSNKIGIIGLGIIIKKEVVRKIDDNSISRVELTLKSVDKNLVGLSDESADSSGFKFLHKALSDESADSSGFHSFAQGPVRRVRQVYRLT
ncbi:hypothetical protein DFH28DRAFT_922766 [Melampsora americana]|nr:hypothetical protein DFH28DRAFT_922766 [Melampsora americana]